ncbi:hypothetical protein N7516_003471 [Penicillium verrucosum]|uniref:uncharacterized protein n=1 Tax=Penicillium verrucosum TaxID=60171 RepID=UPI002545A44B|nr:uncharacterized protein N7516_003471 [Penicillium verrucosum]KAJ5943303.1 hypothetical protein N7516_003471 [Penicillium verrucosum]
MALNGNLRRPQRYITSHNNEGQATIDTTIEPAAPFYELPDKVAQFALGYVTKEFPAKLTDEADVKSYQEFLASPPGLTVSTGSVLRYVDMPPGQLSPMHRTISLDYGVVLEGEVELVLDSGETRVLKRGDVAVQRATMHAWRNTSDAEWARMLYVLLPSTAPNVGEKQLGEEYGDMQGVKSSE